MLRHRRVELNPLMLSKSIYFEQIHLENARSVSLLCSFCNQSTFQEQKKAEFTMNGSFAAA